MPKSMWRPFWKERSLKGWIVTAGALLLVLGALTGGLFVFSSRPPTSAHAQSATGEWSTTSPLPIARDSHTATLLPNGKVLVAGGTGSAVAEATAYLYDPATATWTQTGSMSVAHLEHTATLLPNGKVLVVGGIGRNPNTILTSAELYDPVTGSWTVTGSMQTPRHNHTATLLPNGKVLVVGGRTERESVPTSTAELYDPATGTWTLTGSMQAPRYWDTATLLPNGKVLVIGGQASSDKEQPPTSTAELYNPATGTWTSTDSMQTGRRGHTVTLLNTGKVLVAGGWDGTSILASAELYDPASGTWTTTGSLHQARELHTATLLTNGQVLAAAGSDGSSGNSAELYDPATGTWTTTSSLQVARVLHTATLLPNGQVLVVGGSDLSGQSLASAEVFTPPAPSIQGDYQGTALEITNHPPHAFTMHLVQSGQNLTGTVTLDGGSSFPVSATFTTGLSFAGQITLPTSSVPLSGTIAVVSPIQLVGAVGGQLPGTAGPLRFLVTRV